MRVDAPVHGLFRTNNQPAQLVASCELEADTKVMMLWAAGSLDPTVFLDPGTRFDLDRDIDQVRKHLAFGYGIHICRGAPLSRIEAQLFLEAVLRPRFPDLRPDGEVKFPNCVRPSCRASASCRSPGTSAVSLLSTVGTQLQHGSATAPQQSRDRPLAGRRRR